MSEVCDSCGFGRGYCEECRKKEPVTSSRLQDIEAWIKIVETEKGKGVFFKFFNRLAVPWAMFRKTDDWLARLYFDKKQEEERIRFENGGLFWGW